MGRARGRFPGQSSSSATLPAYRQITWEEISGYALTVNSGAPVLSESPTPNTSFRVSAPGNYDFILGAGEQKSWVSADGSYTAGIRVEIVSGTTSTSAGTRLVPTNVYADANRTTFLRYRRDSRVGVVDKAIEVYDASNALRGFQEIGGVGVPVDVEACCARIQYGNATNVRSGVITPCGDLRVSPANAARFLPLVTGTAAAQVPAVADSDTARAPAGGPFGFLTSNAFNATTAVVVDVTFWVWIPGNIPGLGTYP